MRDYLKSIIFSDLKKYLALSRSEFVDKDATAGIADFHWHDTRHTAASRLVMAGVDLYTVKEILGHKTIVMTQRYSHLSPGHQRMALEKLADREAGK